MFIKSIPWYGLLLLLLLNSCSAHRIAATQPQQSSLIAGLEQAAGKSLPQAPLNPQGELTLKQALQMAFQHNPGLGAAHHAIAAAESRVLQAGLYPNPHVDIELENLAGSGPLSGVDGMESTLAISQTILLGGKRRKQVAAAALQSDLAAWEVERQRLDLYAEVHGAFNKLLIAQQDIALKNELVALSEKLLDTISERVRAGRVSPAEASRAQVILAQNRIALERARRLLLSARQHLAATWGSPEAQFSAAHGEFDLLFTLPPEDSLKVGLIQNPDLARFKTARQQQQAAIALEDSRAIPDPTLSGGIRHLNESGDMAVIVGLSIPLPFSDRNQGSREAARHNLARIEKEEQAAQTELGRNLSEAYNRFQAVQTEVLALKEQIIPQAENAYRRINEGYLQGRFDFLDVLDAQRTLFESKDRYLHALREFHETVVGIERLIAQKIH